MERDVFCKIRPFTIHSRKLGRDLTFSRPGSGYIYVDINGQPGTLGKQICYGGGFIGATMSYSGDSQESFDTICRSWWRAFLKTEREV